MCYTRSQEFYHSENESCTTNDATMYDDDSANQIPVPKTPPTVIKRSKRNVNSSKFNQSGRMSKNCATYYFKHRDTDSDRQMIDTDEKTQEESSEEEWTYAGGEKQPLEGDMHLIDGEGDVAMEDQSSKDKTEGCVPEKAKNIELNETQSIHNENEVAVKAKLEQNAQQNLCKENITRLVNQADEWVQKQAHHQGSPVSVKKIKVSRNFKPLSFDGEGKGVNKMSRINEWLRQHSDGKADNSLQSVDSYDASGECTTGESEADKQSVTSEEPSLDTYRNMTCSMEMSMISSTSTITPSNNTTPVHHGKVTLRKKKTNASGTRPWSVSCLSQLTLGTNEPTGVSGSSLNTTPVQPTNTTSAYSRVSGMSISESALNTIVSPSHNMMSHKLNKAKQGKVQSSTSSVKTAIQGHISSTTTINDACISCYENADPKQCSMRRKRLKLRRRQQAHLSGELDFEDIRPEQRTKMSKRQDRLVKCSSFSGQPTERIEDRLERNTASDPSSSRKNRFDTSSASGNDSDEGMTTQQPAILPCSKRTEQSTTDQDPSSAELQAENVRPSFKVGPAGGWVRGRLSLTERDKDRADMLGLNLGDPALLWDVSADKDSDIDRSIRTGGTEEHSSFSEQAWDSYQEKYNSEPYSEAPDSDAARQLLECDDYRAFLDSQSDCCSSLSAHPDHDTSPHNFTRRRPNLDDHREKSLPRYRKPGKVELTDSSLPRRIKKTSLSSAERKKNLMDSLERSKISSSADNTEIVRRRKILHDSTDRRMSKKTSLSDSFDRLNLQPHGHRRRHSSNTTSSDVNSSFEYTSINHQNRPDLLDTLNRRTRKQSANSERSRDSSELQNQADSSLNSADSRQSHNDESLESYAGDLMPVLRKRGFSLSLQVRNDAGNISDAMESDLERYDIRSHVQRSVSQLEFTESMFAKQETSPDLIRSGDYVRHKFNDSDFLKTNASAVIACRDGGALFSDDPNERQNACFAAKFCFAVATISLFVLICYMHLR